MPHESVVILLDHNDRELLASVAALTILASIDCFLIAVPRRVSDVAHNTVPITAQVLAWIREEAGLTQVEFAERAK